MDGYDLLRAVSALCYPRLSTRRGARHGCGGGVGSQAAQAAGGEFNARARVRPCTGTPATGCPLLGLIIDGPGTTAAESTVVPWGPFTLPQDTAPPQQPHYSQFVLPSPSIISVLDQPRLNIFIIDFLTGDQFENM